MELCHLINLISELPQGKIMKYVRGNDMCTYLRVDTNEPRVFAKTNTGDEKSWAPSFLEELSEKICENVPFNISAILNNKGSFRPVIDTIIAHTKEFYWVKKGTAIETVWIPSKPKKEFELGEILLDEIPKPKISKINNQQSELLSPDELINKVRDSFTRFVHLVNVHTNDFTNYIADFEKYINPLITDSFPQYKNVFQIVDIDVFNGVIAKLQEKDPEQKNVFADEYNGTRYAAFRTTKYYRTYLQILAFSDFRSNISQQKKEIIAVAATSVVEKLRTHLLAMRTKPFLLLAGISGTGKSRIVKQMAFESCPDIDVMRKDPTSPGNYQLIEVKPNWHDSTEVLGYESEIGGSHYVVTPFVKFLVKAMQYEDKAPFFVCMDEMNLAPVEQYFAEFLSVLESRKLIDGKITSEPLIKADIFKKYESSLKAELFNLPKESITSYSDTTSDTAELYGDFNNIYERLKTEGLRIPSNLIVVGTVNMDETTHQFSRKVIDRAMTIEMNIEDAETPFKDFFEGGDALHYYDNPQPQVLFLPKVVQAADALAQLSEEDSEYLKANVPQLLYNLNKALDGTPFKIAYRVQNELVLYFYSLREEKPNTDAETLLASAMDSILMMKVLPRIEGDEDLLEKPLKALAEFTEVYPQASKKIAEMQERLPQAHFTSFWP